MFEQNGTIENYNLTWCFAGAIMDKYIAMVK
jgi:hypothetical protein